MVIHTKGNDLSAPDKVLVDSLEFDMPTLRKLRATISWRIEAHNLLRTRCY